jgi:spermidine synthase
LVPWSLLDAVAVPGEASELRLLRRGAEFAIMLGRAELMNSRRGGSEAALATLSAARIADRPRVRMLIGGLGMGFTLRAALVALGADAHVDVAELVPAVVAWARGPMAELFGDSLKDSRVAIRESDVVGSIRGSAAAYDAILLDVDNGPEALTRAGNDALYNREGLAAAHAALRPEGVLAVWSAVPDDRFVRSLKNAGFAVEETRVHAHGSRGTRHVIWIATRLAGRGRGPSDTSRLDARQRPPGPHARGRR